MTTTLTALCMPWHLAQSNAFHKILVQPLRGVTHINLTPWDQDPELPLALFAQHPERPLIFCQLPPPPELLAKPAARLVWLPMWDHVARWPEAFWRGLPRQLKVVALSEPVHQLATGSGLPTLRLQFYLNAQNYAQVDWQVERTMLYWNRVNLYSLQALRRICRDLAIQRLVHVQRPDPGYAHPSMNLPKTLEQTRVETVRSFLPAQEHGRLLDQCQFCLAPRPVEGVGLALLESMARGACVVAYDAPAANEYIAHGQNGYLLRAYSRTIHKWRKSLHKRWAALIHPHTSPPPYHMVGAGQVGKSLAKVSAQALGTRARSDHLAGYERWKQGLEAYADFLLRWDEG